MDFLINKIIGEWEDEKGNHYEVEKDDDGFSCSVRTTRPEGKIQHTKGMLKFDSKADCLMWGRSYYLQPDPHDKKKIHWQPLKNVPAYTWIRCGDCPETETESCDDRELPTLEQVIGAWRDDDGAVYTITMDASGDSASASIKRQDGRRFEAKETIKCGEQGLCWADAYMLQPVEGDGSSICWICKKSKRSFWWESIPDKGPFVVTSCTLKSLLAQMVGSWKDEECSLYNVSLDKDGESCTVETQRPDGRTRVSQGLLKYDSKMQCVMWGKSYYLEVQGAGDVVWVHAGRGKSFRWLLEHKSWAQASLEKLVGTWEDQDENLYTVTLDKPPISCSVQTDRLDGASRHFQAMLKADKDSKSIWWGTGYYVDMEPGWPNILDWLPWKESKPKFTWKRCSSC